MTSYTAVTAAEQARYCVNNEMLITKDELRPGDVIFCGKMGVTAAGIWKSIMLLYVLKVER